MELRLQPSKLHYGARRVRRPRPTCRDPPVLIMGDALYGCGPIAQLCVQQEWKYCFTFKEGRQPTMWDESIRLFGVDDSRTFQYTTGTDAKPVAHDVRWVEDMAFVNGLTATAVNEVETPVPANFRNVTHAVCDRNGRSCVPVLHAPRRETAILNSGCRRAAPIRNRWRIDGNLDSLRKACILLVWTFCISGGPDWSR